MVILAILLQKGQESIVCSLCKTKKMRFRDPYKYTIRTEEVIVPKLLK
jgi:hypothetical protein